MRDLRCFCRVRRTGLSSSRRSSRSLPDLAECLDLRLVRLGLLSRMARNHSVDKVDVLSIRLRNVLERLTRLRVSTARRPHPDRRPRNAVLMNPLNEVGHLERGERLGRSPVIDDLFPLGL